MTEEAHIIEIESIVLDGVDPHGPGVRALVEAETRRVLLGLELSKSEAVAGREAAVAGAVAGAVERGVRGGRNA